MATVYVPKGTKRKSKAEIQKTAEAYLTQGRYDQGKSAMIAAAHKERILERQKKQALQRKYLRASALVFARMERLIENTLVWKGAHDHREKLRTPQALVQTQLMTHGSRRKQQKEVKGLVHA